MVGMPVVGSVGVAVRPTFSGTQKAIGKEFTGAGARAGSSFNNTFTRTLTNGAKIAATAGLAALGTTLAQGFGRLTAMEDAKAALAGLGYEAKDVNRIMKDVEGALGDTIFRYADGASVAAGALAAGVEQGEELEAYLRLTADAATQAGVEYNDMGMIMNQVTGDGRLMGDTVRQLAQNGIYVLPMLADEFGVTQEAMRKMVSNGEVDADTFRRVMEENIGGSAARASETTRGALALAWASVGQLGEALLTDLMPHIRGAAQSFTEFMYAMQPVAAEIGERLIPVVESLFNFLADNTWVIKSLTAVVVAGTAAWVAFRAAMAIKGFISGAVLTMVGLTDAVRGFVLAARGTEKAALLLRNSSLAAQGGASAFALLSSPIRAAREAAEGFRLAQSGVTTGLTHGTRSLQAGAGMYRVYAPAVTAAAGAQRGFNWAVGGAGTALAGLGGIIRAHPIMAIATALAAAAAGLTYFFTQTETGQKIWESLKETMQPVIESVMPAIQSMGESVGNTFSGLAESAGGTLFTIAESVGSVFGSIVETVVPILATVVEAIGGFVASIGPALLELGGLIFDALVPVFQTIGEYLSPMITQISEALAPLLPMFAEAGQQIMEAFVPVVDQVMTELVPAFMELGEALAGIVPMLIEALAPILPMIADAFAMLVEALAPLIPMLIDALAPIIPMIADAFAMLVSALVPMVAILVQSLLPMLPLLVDAFSMLISAILPLVPLLIEAIAPIIPLIVEAFMGLVQAILPLIPMLIGALAPILAELATLFTEIVAALVPLVVAIIEAVIPAVLAILPALIQLVVLVIEMVIPVIQAILSVVVTVFEALAPIISAALTIVQGVIQTITALITGDWSGAWDGIKMILFGTWELIKSIVTGALEVVWSVISSALTLISDLWSIVWNTLASVLTWVWETLIQPVFRALGEFLKWVYDTFISPVIGWIMDKWDTMSSNLRSVYDNYIKPMFERFGEIVTNLKDKFQTAVDNIKKAWDKIKSITKAPIKFVIDTVINKGLVGAFNTLVAWIPGVNKLKEVDIEGFSGGGYTGDGHWLEPAGVVHRGEYVLPKHATNRLRQTIGLDGLEHMRHTGRLPGYSDGGLVRPVSGPLTSRFGAGRGRYPHAGVDWAVPIGTPVKAALAGTALGHQPVGRTGRYVFLAHPGNRNTYYGHLSRPMVSAGQDVAKGQVIGLSGNTGNSTGPHLHFETWTGGKPVNPLSYMGGLPASADGGDGGGFSFNPLQPLLDLVGGITGKVNDAFSAGGRFVDVAKGFGKKVFDDIIEWAKSKLNFFGDPEDTAKGSGTVSKGPVQDQVKSIADGFGWGSGAEWSALSSIIQKESSWDPMAANPSSTARGLFQMIAANRTASFRDVPGHTRDGLNYIKGRYGSPSSALAFHNRNNWYDTGGLVTKPDHHLFRDQGGNLPPGLSMVLNNSGRDEAILNHQQWSDIHKLATRGGSGGENHYHYHSSHGAPTVSDFVHEVDHRTRRMQGV